MHGQDVFVSLPTESRKSLCHSILPDAFNSLQKSSSCIAVDVSPLERCLSDYIGDVVDKDKVLKGTYKLVFTSPESILTNTLWRDMLQNTVYQENLVALVVDEAHCVKKWYVHDHNYSNNTSLNYCCNK